MASKNNLTGVLKTISEETEGSNISVGDMLEALEGKGYGPMLLVPALVTVLPTGAIPGVPAVSAVLIIFFTIQILVGRETPWLPERMKSVSIRRSRLDRVIKKMSPYTRKVDTLVRRRLQFLTRNDSARLLVALISLPLAVCMLVIGFIPLMPALLALPIVFFALGLSVHDGLVFAVGFICLIGLAIALPFIL